MCFRLVDSPGIQWGEESKLRAEVETLYAKFVACPIVCLCVQGGPGTVELLFESAKKKTPCVIVAHSGGGVRTQLEQLLGRLTPDRLTTALTHACRSVVATV